MNSSRISARNVLRTSFQAFSVLAMETLLLVETEECNLGGSSTVLRGWGTTFKVVAGFHLTITLDATQPSTFKAHENSGVEKRSDIPLLFRMAPSCGPWQEIMVQSRPANSSASRLVKVSDADQYIDTGHVGYADLEVERRGELVRFIASAARVLESLPEFEVSDKCIEIATRTDSAQNERLRLAAVETRIVPRTPGCHPRLGNAPRMCKLRRAVKTRQKTEGFSRRVEESFFYLNSANLKGFRGVVNGGG
ncbi:hypothetical protein CPB85DRAFT_1251791 [Mucidula mucida]|nr:hypothetical protein CPB85DRAFT_1251791 [Mucidula mucida]